MELCHRREAEIDGWLKQENFETEMLRR